MKKIIVLLTLILFLFGSMFSGVAQVAVPSTYYSFTAKFLLGEAADEQKKVKSEKENISKQYIPSGVISFVEDNALYSLATPTSHIDFTAYSTLCNTYFLSPGKKYKCRKRLDYLKESHDVVFNLLSISTRNKIRKGIGEQIWFKYASICTIILRDLKKLKREADDSTILNFYNYKQ